MGYYIDPEGMSKEQFLRDHGTRSPSVPEKHRDGGRVAVCLVDNGWMTAAGIAYCQEELEAFNRPEDRRPKTWYWVPEELLTPFMMGRPIK